MNQQDYHELNSKISVELDNFLLSKYQQLPEWKNIKGIFEIYLRRRVGKTRSRDCWVYFMAKILGIDVEKDKEKLFYLMALPEIHIMAAYMTNWVMDNKNQDFEGANKVYLILNNFLISLPVLLLPKDLPNRDKIIELFYYNNYRTALGYEVEINRLTITNFENIKTDKEYWKLANVRNFDAVGNLYSYIIDILVLGFELNLDLKLVNKIKSLAEQFGANVEVNGDLADFIIPNELCSTAEKRPKKDYFVDIKCNILTYTTLKALRRSKYINQILYNEIIESAKTGKYEIGFYSRFHNFLKQELVVQRVLDYLKKEKIRMLKEIKAIEKSFDIKDVGVSQGFAMWKISLNILTHNKFIKQLKEDYEIKN